MFLWMNYNIDVKIIISFYMQSAGGRLWPANRQLYNILRLYRQELVALLTPVSLLYSAYRLLWYRRNQQLWQRHLSLLTEYQVGRHMPLTTSLRLAIWSLGLLPQWLHFLLCISGFSFRIRLLLLFIFLFTSFSSLGYSVNMQLSA